MSQIQQAILLIANSAAVAQAIISAFEKASEHPIHLCRDSAEARNYLDQHPNNGSQTKLVILDDGVAGMELLAEIKKDERLRSIPVVALTGSCDEQAVRRLYQAGANGCLSKTVDPDTLVRLIQRLIAFWFETAVLPNEPTNIAVSSAFNNGRVSTR